MPAASRRAVPPEDAAAGARQRLTALGSFRFTLSYRAEIPVEIEARFRGRWQTPGREEWQGTVRRAGDASRVRIVASGQDQYDMTPAGWSRGRRGIEADVVEQVFVALGREAAQFAGESLGLYLYRFRPMLPVVDPTNAMSLSGALLLDRSGVPVLVKADDRSGTTVWQATLGDFGRAGPVDVPFVPALTVQAAPLPRTGCCGMSAAVTGLRSRLDALGWRYRLTAGRGLALSLDQALMRSDLALLLGAGRVELWRGRAVEAPDAGGASDSLVAVAGDVARWVRLTRFIARNAEFDPLADVGMPSAPRLVVAGSVNAADSGDVAVLLIDGTAVASCRAQADGTLSFQDVGGPMTVRIMAVVCRLKPLPVGFAVATRG